MSNDHDDEFLDLMSENPINNKPVMPQCLLKIAILIRAYMAHRKKDPLTTADLEEMEE